jgi:hypothetical protein
MTSPEFRQHLSAAHHAHVRAPPRLQLPQRVRSARLKRLPSILPLHKPRSVLLHDRLHGRALRIRGQVKHNGVPRVDVCVRGRAGAGEGGSGAGEHPGGQERGNQVARQARFHTPSYAGRDRRGAPGRLEEPA